MTVLTPSKQTLARYGLSEKAWKEMLDRQNGKCYICEKEPQKGRLCIDHFHVKGWKSLPPEKRVEWVRGLLCWYCNNRFLSRGIDVKKAQNIVKYLEAFEAKKLEELSKSMPKNLLKKEENQ